MNEEQLQWTFRDYNDRWFAGRLSDAAVRYGYLGDCYGQVCDGTLDGFTITLNARYAHDERVIGMTLLHEMAHMALWPYKGHDKRFEKEMQRLALAGAFKGLW